MSARVLLAALTGGDAATRFNPRQWEQLLIEARAAMLTARLAEKAREEGWYEFIPPAPRRHLEAARRVCVSQQHTVRWEMRQIERALSAAEGPVVLLKGSAYVMSDLPAARGRIFSDIDIMVPRARLKRAEQALLGHGWYSNVDGYDRYYYETWMHELPALQHVQRASVIDLHHTIAPPTSRTPVDAEKLIAAARPIANSKILYVLAPTDMLLHSALHLIQEGEFRHGLRDLLDIDGLFRDFGRDADFWAALHQRASELGLARPLYYAVRLARQLLETPIPEAFLTAMERFRPNMLSRRVMASLLEAALAAPGARPGGYVAGARAYLYLRGHYLRMPLRLLIPHLLRKSGMRIASIGGGRPIQDVALGGRVAN